VSGYNDRYTWMRQGGEGTQLSKAQIRESIDASLARLETDYLDVLQLHWPERPMDLTGPRGKGVVGEDGNTRGHRSRGITPIEEQVEAIAEAVDAGKVREWGLSNEDSSGVLAFRAAAEAIGLRPPAVVQNAYSLLQRADEYSLVPEALEPSADRPAISYLAYSPLSAGVLTGKYTKGAATDPRKGPKARTRLGMFRGYEKSFLQTQGPKAVAAYVAVARKHRLKVTPSQLAIAHCASRDFVTSTIIGATSTLQLAENLQASSCRTSPHASPPSRLRHFTTAHAPTAPADSRLHSLPPPRAPKRQFTPIVLPSGSWLVSSPGHLQHGPGPLPLSCFGPRSPAAGLLHRMGSADGAGCPRGVPQLSRPMAGASPRRRVGAAAMLPCLARNGPTPVASPRNACIGRLAAGATD
jgi:aryl-alcohol dehydrogenase-like predicted oxidoreductase